MVFHSHTLDDLVYKHTLSCSLCFSDENIFLSLVTFLKLIIVDLVYMVFYYGIICLLKNNAIALTI